MAKDRAAPPSTATPTTTSRTASMRFMSPGAYRERTLPPSIAFGFRSGHNRAAMLMDSAKGSIDAHSMILSGDRVLVAVSGGIDSVVLLDVLYRLSPKWPFHLLVGHIDHGLRAAASVEDAAFVRALAGHYGLACVQCSLSDADLDRHRSQGREGAARRARLNTRARCPVAIRSWQGQLRE